jgi:Tfp pilus assembly protein PilX
MSNHTKLLCLFLKAQKINKSSEQGYAMAIVSLLTIILFSLLAASLVFSNLAKSRTDAFVDGTSAFAVAESGLNKRAVEFRAKLETYSGVTDISASPANRTLANCFGEGLSAATSTGLNYLGCRNYSFESSNNVSRVAQNGGISLGGGEDKSNYVAYTLISNNAPQNISIPTGDDYAGLNAAEYKYVLQATAKKPVNSKGSVTGSVTPTAEEAAAGAKADVDKTPADLALIAAYEAKQAAANVAATNSAAAGESSSNISLSMTFTNRVISLFQFAVFYNGDLEFNSTSPMQVQGWVHSNANIYTQPAGDTDTSAPKSITTFLSKVSAGGSIYNRVDAWTPGIGRTGITRVLLTGSSCPATETLPSDSGCRDIPPTNYGNYPADKDPLTATQIGTFGNKIQTGTTPLKIPAPSFARKRSYALAKVGEYFSKADMRLEFVPDRAMPFNFTAMTTAGSGTCSTTAPLANTDPAANYVDPKREGFSTLKCDQLTKGQLQSLRQPVMVLTKLNNNALATQESTTLNRPTLPTKAALTTLNDNEPNKNKILRALQVALVSTPDPISLDQLNGIAFNDPTYLDTTDPSYSASLNAFRAEFSRQLDVIFPASSTATAAQRQADRDDKRALLSARPSEIVALQDAWFLPAPIQRVGTRTVQDAANNPRSSGFYDGRERRWISVLQTNIASLSVWNRDGLYVAADNETMTSAYAASTTNRDLAFADATTASRSTSGLVFTRAAADSTKPVGSLQHLGLGSIDQTEGGLIIHTSVNDDLNGSGGTLDAATDITRDTTKPIQETKTVNGVTTTTTIDYYRTYPGVTGSPKSPFAFAFTGGDYLPNNLLLSSDQAVYLQGDFNNNKNRNIDGVDRAISATAANTPSDARLSASVIGDTITVLSNNCVSLTLSPLGVPAGQLNCGLQDATNIVATPTVINAAFLSNTDVSTGNLGTGRGYDASKATNKYSGGVNNYIRLLEDWNNGGTGNPIALNYMGSLISLGAPLEYSGQYRPGGEAAVAGSPGTPASYYNIPFRNFNYDPNFSDVDKMPPLTPKASYVQQKNFSRVY